MEPLILYVIAGPHDIGKTTATYNLIPRSVPVINADEITRVAKLTGIVPDVNVVESSNRKAARLIQDMIDERKSFAIETTLSDEESWNFLIGLRNSGYRLQLIFLCTDNISLLNWRIEERALRGEPFVDPWDVEERYIISLQLLSQYFDIPVRIQLIDNSDRIRLILEKTTDLIDVTPEPLPWWVRKYLSRHLSVKEDGQLEAKKLPSKTDVKKFYLKTLKNK